jgi:hypothetical protein
MIMLSGTFCDVTPPVPFVVRRHVDFKMTSSAVCC